MICFSQLPTLAENFRSPTILFLTLGVLAGRCRSDLHIPDSISRYLTIYMMMAIGIKGGSHLHIEALSKVHSLGILVSSIGLSAVLSLIAFMLLKKTTKLDLSTMAAVSASYGSISIVTLATACHLLEQQAVQFDGLIMAAAALMEVPAIIMGLWLAKRFSHNYELPLPAGIKREVFTNGAVLLLLGSFFIGWFADPCKIDMLQGFLVDPFQGILCLFMLDVGLSIAKQARDIRQLSPSVLAFSIYMPLTSALLGLFTCKLLGVNQPDGFLLVTLCSSASYIAAPAAMRQALPQAQASIYLSMALGLTFPFNILFGLPLYYALCHFWLLP